jgi:hypothetical protein
VPSIFVKSEKVRILKGGRSVYSILGGEAAHYRLASVLHGWIRHLLNCVKHVSEQVSSSGVI